jgi:hypothetical protein
MNCIYREQFSQHQRAATIIEPQKATLHLSNFPSLVTMKHIHSFTLFLLSALTWLPLVHGAES